MGILMQEAIKRSMQTIWKRWMNDLLWVVKLICKYLACVFFALVLNLQAREGEKGRKYQLLFLRNWWFIESWPIVVIKVHSNSTKKHINDAEMTNYNCKTSRTKLQLQANNF